jgi:hypothetical protein
LIISRIEVASRWLKEEVPVYVYDREEGSKLLLTDIIFTTKGTIMCIATQIPNCRDATD